mmetsp:Transcript_69719/g.185960  ORF Transcript_69719/g.185960 Transcript_69719/m.185960 type:complete len:464 (+) Transcript_69719:268-1659(+)
MPVNELGFLELDHLHGSNGGPRRPEQPGGAGDGDGPVHHPNPLRRAEPSGALLPRARHHGVGADQRPRRHPARHAAGHRVRARGRHAAGLGREHRVPEHAVGEQLRRRVQEVGHELQGDPARADGAAEHLYHGAGLHRRHARHQQHPAGQLEAARGPLHHHLRRRLRHGGPVPHGAGGAARPDHRLHRHPVAVGQQHGVHAAAGQRTGAGHRGGGADVGGRGQRHRRPVPEGVLLRHRAADGPRPPQHPPRRQHHHLPWDQLRHLSGGEYPRGEGGRHRLRRGRVGGLGVGQRHPLPDPPRLLRGPQRRPHGEPDRAASEAVAVVQHRHHLLGPPHQRPRQRHHRHHRHGRGLRVLSAHSRAAHHGHDLQVDAVGVGHLHPLQPAHRPAAALLPRRPDARRGARLALRHEPHQLLHLRPQLHRPLHLGLVVPQDGQRENLRPEPPRGHAALAQREGAHLRLPH